MIHEKLENIRRELLDLTRRNRLLNHSTKGKRSLRIVDELPEEVYRLLAVEQKSMSFLSRTEASTAAQNVITATKEENEVDLSLYTAPGHSVVPEKGDRSSEDAYDRSFHFDLAPLEKVTTPAERHTDRNLQTSLDDDVLQKRLLHLDREARSALEEQGANTLYLTLGLVEWVEGRLTSRAPLLFVPVQLTRKTVRTRHKVSLVDEDIVTNPCLDELCKRRFRVNLPVFETDMETDAEPNLSEFFKKVEDTIEHIEGWKFFPDIHIGLFSFHKYLMYRDLDPAAWKSDQTLSGHPLVKTLLGCGEEHSGLMSLPDPHDLDKEVPPAECFQVKDADSSQQVAILAAKQGVSCVIQGPPGTGKSQTITNIIAECLADGKTVLFVAEKAAALEVVERRLHEVGIGRFALELHSKKSRKRAVLDDIAKSIDTPPARTKHLSTDPEILHSTRNRLNEYVEALHTPVGALEISPYDAIGKLSRKTEVPASTFTESELWTWDQTRLEHSLDALDVLDGILETVGDQTIHSWRGVNCRNTGIQKQENVKVKLRELETRLSELVSSGVDLANWLGATHPHSCVGLQMLRTHADLVITAPTLTAAQLTDPDWELLAGEIQEWLDWGSKRQALVKEWQETLSPEAEDQDWSAILERRRKYGGSIFRFVRPTWRSDSRLIFSYVAKRQKLSVDEQIHLLGDVKESADLRRRIEQAYQCKKPFGKIWTDIDGDWEALRRVVTVARDLGKLVSRNKVKAQALEHCLQPENRQAFVEQENLCGKQLAGFDSAWQAWMAELESSDVEWLGEEYESASFGKIEERHANLDSRVGELRNWSAFVEARDRCRSTVGSVILEWALSKGAREIRGSLNPVFKRRFYALWLDQIAHDIPAIAQFSRGEREALIKKFCKLDKDWLVESRNRLVETIWTRVPNLSGGGSRHSKLGLVKAEIRKKRRHMPIRKLFSRAGEVIQRIKPCFMMSPLSVAQYLTPGEMSFDVVIFDEASQVEPADALGAISRGKQLILVGDEKQLPPTNFFNSVEADNDVEGGEDAYEAHDLESILSLGNVHMPSVSLRWHYRSRDSSLIQFSNESFYEGHLRVFPSSSFDRENMGLSLRYVEDGVYMRGKGQHNPVEAREVAKAVIDHAKSNPQKTLGVGAFSSAQQRAIEDEIETLRRAEPDTKVESFFMNDNGEPFFVKNLETIQGDERDHIFLSVGYGKDDSGRLTMNFGPLNRDEGWRRLNVLVTRARERCVVFSSIVSDDIALDRIKSKGVRSLKEYLYFADRGSVRKSSVPDGDHDSPFEAEVCRVLRDRGWEVYSQVGCAGFAIDLGVVDPDHPGRYLLGVECDGATYHSSATARDRDRLRQSVLEGLGWRIHRIWSTDWFYCQDKVIEELFEVLDRCRSESGSPDAVMNSTSAEIDDNNESDQAALDGHLEYSEGRAEQRTVVMQDLHKPDHWRKNEKVDGLYDGVVIYDFFETPCRGDREQLNKLSDADVWSIIKAVLVREAPVHEKRVAQVIARCYDTKASTRVFEKFKIGLRYGKKRAEVVVRGKFLWKPGSDELPVRYRGGSCPVTHAEQIPAEEYRVAILNVVEREFGISSSDLVASVRDFMGFNRAGRLLTREIKKACRSLLGAGDLLEDSTGHLVKAREVD